MNRPLVPLLLIVIFALAQGLPMHGDWIGEPQATGETADVVEPIVGTLSAQDIDTVRPVWLLPAWALALCLFSIAAAAPALPSPLYRRSPRFLQPALRAPPVPL